MRRIDIAILVIILLIAIAVGLGSCSLQHEKSAQRFDQAVLDNVSVVQAAADEWANTNGHEYPHSIHEAGQLGGPSLLEMIKEAGTMIRWRYNPFGRLGLQDGYDFPQAGMVAYSGYDYPSNHCIIWASGAHGRPLRLISKLPDGSVHYIALSAIDSSYDQPTGAFPDSTMDLMIELKR